MKRYLDEDIFFLSSHCKVTKGINRSIIVDYSRNDIYTISNDFYDLIELLDRSKVQEIVELLEDDSLSEFTNFMDFMLENEIAFLDTDLERLPRISDELLDEHIVLKDCIIEIDITTYNEALFHTTIHQIDEAGCDDIKIRFLSDVDFEFVKRVLEIANDSDIFCIEVDCANGYKISRQEWFSLIETIPTLSNVFLFNCSVNEVVDFLLHRDGHWPLLMGHVYYIKTELSEHNCGVISMENLSFIDIHMHNLLKSFNGCLYKKLTIDKYGNIKNCPYIQSEYGNIVDKPIKEVIMDSSFRQLWFIKKNDIETCRDCEFRYNCTDCRAFLVNESDLYSKPLKCGYNPYTNEWSEWSTNPLRYI